MILFLFYLFFFKQKTAYDMRISDWSSDVCSSDLGIIGALFLRFFRKSLWPDGRSAIHRFSASRGQVRDDGRTHRSDRPRLRRCTPNPCSNAPPALRPCQRSNRPVVLSRGRSEEHTSELQSLMRISYAVFCLKKKNI